MEDDAAISILLLPRSIEGMLFSLSRLAFLPSSPPLLFPPPIRVDVFRFFLGAGGEIRSHGAAERKEREEQGGGIRAANSWQRSVRCVHNFKI